MRVETIYCDICDKKNARNTKLQVVDTLSKSLELQEYDLCNECKQKILNGHSVFVHGINNRWEYNRKPKFFKSIHYDFTLDKFRR